MTQHAAASVTAPESREQRGWTVEADTLGARLALIRQRMDWNVKEAADATGIPASTWTEWERKGRAPTALHAAVRQIADRTGCSYLWLLAGPEATGAGQ